MFMLCDEAGQCSGRWASVAAGPVPGFLVSEVPACSSGPSLPNVPEALVSALTTGAEHGKSRWAGGRCFSSWCRAAVTHELPCRLYASQAGLGAGPTCLSRPGQ